MRICVDAAHGGYDVGASDGEKDVTLEHAFALRRALQALGFSVVMTRVKDLWIPAGERCEIANREHCVVYVSLHASMPFAVRYWGTSARSGTLAETLCNAVRAYVPEIEDPLVHADTTALDLRFTHCPAVQVELGQTAEPRLQDPVHRTYLASTLATALRTFVSSGTTYT